jgi:hypothetical protein
MPRAPRHLILLVLLTSVAGHPAAAQAGHGTLHAWATGWSQGGTATCREQAGMADFPPSLRLQECSWPRVTRGRQFSDLTGTASLDNGLHALMWQHAVTDSVSAARLADSLGMALRGAGLREYACPRAGRRWQTPGLAVQYSPAIVHPDGLLRVLVFATTIPRALPDFSCPDAPKLETAPRSRTGSRAAT